MHCFSFNALGRVINTYSEFLSSLLFIFVGFLSFILYIFHTRVTATEAYPLCSILMLEILTLFLPQSTE